MQLRRKKIEGGVGAKLIGDLYKSPPPPKKNYNKKVWGGVSARHDRNRINMHYNVQYIIK